METLIWILFGVMTGWMASVIMGAVGRDQILRNLLLGVLGSLTGSLIVNFAWNVGISPNSLSITASAITSGLIIWSGKFLSNTRQDFRKEQVS